MPGKITRAKPRKSNDYGSAYRCVESFDSLVQTAYDDRQTIDAVFEQAAKKFSSHQCLGTRELLSEAEEKQPDGKVFTKATFGDYKWMTFKEVHESVSNMSEGLHSLGLKTGEKIAIFLETQAEWMISAQACFKSNFTLVTVYATLGEEGIIYSLNQTKVKYIITSSNLLMSKLKNCLHKIPELTTIVYVDSGNKVSGLPDNITLQSFKEVVESGSKNKTEHPRPCPQDHAIIMYTSGTTGNPKGVVISHSNFVAAMSGISLRVPNLGTDDTYIAYLPLAHVLELVAEMVIICGGARVGYSSPLTLTDKSSRILTGTKGDATVLQPTIMAAVPEIMERIRKSVMHAVNDMGYIQYNIFHYSYNYKLRRIGRGEDTPWLNKLIFNKTKALTGGKVRCMLSGAASIDKETQRFMNVCMCCPIGQGYGLTETCGAGTITQVQTDFSTGTVGPPVASCEIKLVPWDEGGYTPENKPNPQGEVWLGGPCITQGYYENDSRTAEDYYVDEDGQRWFKTGDIGEFLEDGSLKIIDRKKDLVKLSHGEYIAVGNIESKLKASPLIDNIWLYASVSQPTALAFIVPNEKALLKLASSKSIASKSMEELCQNSTIVDEMKSALLQATKVAKLQKFEIPQKMVLEPIPWTAESGLVTAAFKLRRKALTEHYQSKIDEMFPRATTP